MANKKLPLVEGEVLHFTTDERSRNWVYDENASKLSREVQIISINKVPEIRKMGIDLPGRRILEGDVFIKHPYEEGVYIDASKAVDQIRLSKYSLISELAQMLGASSYEIEEAIESIEERQWNAEGNLEYKVVKANVNIKNEATLKKTLGISISDTYPGRGVVSEASNKKALTFAKQHNLWEDGMVRSLIRKRQEQENPLLEEHLHFDVTKEANERLDAAFSLNCLGGLFSLDASLNKTLSTRETITLDIKFTFPSI